MERLTDGGGQGFPPNLHTAKGVEMDYNWHETWFDPATGLHMARMGSLCYVLEYPGGRPISSGHHRVFMRNGEVVGEIGSTVRGINLAPSEYRPKD